MDPIINKVFNLINDELTTEKLHKIPKSIYQDIASYIKTTDNLADEEEHTLIVNLIRRERDILTKLAVRLLEIRLAKISIHIYEEVNGLNLTPEEKYLIEPTSRSKKRFDKINLALNHGHTSVLSKISELISSKYVVVRFSQSSSSFIGVDLAKYGPFKTEDVAVLPLDNAKPLLKQGIAQELDLEL